MCSFVCSRNVSEHSKCSAVKLIGHISQREAPRVDSMASPTTSTASRGNFIFSLALYSRSFFSVPPRDETWAQRHVRSLTAPEAPVSIGHTKSFSARAEREAAGDVRERRRRRHRRLPRRRRFCRARRRFIHAPHSDPASENSAALQRRDGPSDRRRLK